MDGYFDQVASRGGKLTHDASRADPLQGLHFGSCLAEEDSELAVEILEKTFEGCELKLSTPAKEEGEGRTPTARSRALRSALDSSFLEAISNYSTSPPSKLVQLRVHLREHGRHSEARETLT